MPRPTPILPSWTWARPFGASWVASVEAAGKRATAQIAVLDPEGTRVAAWDLMDVFPVRWSGPNLDIDTAKVATETLELAHNGFLEPR